MIPKMAKIKNRICLLPQSQRSIVSPPRKKKRLKSQPKRFRMGMKNSLAIKMIKY